MNNDKRNIESRLLSQLQRHRQFTPEQAPVSRFREIAEEMARTYEAKNADYGDAYAEGYRLFGYMQLLSRIYEKFCRVRHILDGGVMKVDEAVADTLTDMANQCIILRMLIEKNNYE